MTKHLISISEAESNLLKAAAYLAENIKSSDGQAEALKEIVGHYIARGDVDLAAQLSDLVDDTFVRDRLLCEVAEKCAAQGDDEYALQLADAIEDSSFQNVARERIAAQKAAQNEFDKAFEIAGTLPHASDALANIAVRQAFSGNDAGALQTASEIEFHSSKVNALQGIAEHFQSRNETVKAGELLSQAALEAREIEFTEEKIRAFLSIAGHYLECAQFDRAIEVLAEARTLTEQLDNVHRDGLLSTISVDFLRAGSIDLADRTLDLVADKTQIASCLASFSTEFDAKGERTEALETLEEANAILKSQKDREIRDSRARYGVFGAVAARFAMFGKFERAIEIALENPMEEERNAALTQIARISVLSDNEDFLRQALDAITENGARLRTLISAADAKTSSDKKDEAGEFLNEALALCETVPQHPVRSAIFNDLAKRFFDRGEPEKAREISLLNLQTIKSILDESQQAILLSQLAALYEDFGFDTNESERQILLTMLRKSGW
jgi:tetratricopeptide (TPR) repeat protein